MDEKALSKATNARAGKRGGIIAVHPVAGEYYYPATFDK